MLKKFIRWGFYTYQFCCVLRLTDRGPVVRCVKDRNELEDIRKR